MPSAQFKKAADESRQLKAKPGNDELLEVSTITVLLYCDFKVQEVDETSGEIGMPIWGSGRE